MPESQELTERGKQLSALDLNSLLETSKILTGSLDAEQTLSHILRTVMGKYLLSRASIVVSEVFQGKERFLLSASRGIPTVVKQFDDINNFMHDYDMEQCFPIASSKRKIGYLLLGRKHTKEPYTESEIVFLESLAALAASALEAAYTVQEIKLLNRNLDQTVQKLKTLFDLTNSYHVGLSRDEILKLLSHTISGQMMMRSYMVCFLGESGKPLAELSLGVELRNLSQGQQFQYELEKIFQVEKPVRVVNDDYPSLYLAGLRHIVPMRNNDNTIGVFLCGERQTKQPYSDTDVEFMSLAAAQAANALEQSRLFKETIEIQAMEKELQVAQEIQAALLPKSLPNIPGIELAAQNIPTKQVGGDYYDIMMIDAEHLFIGIADVTGKGTPAALLMANLQASIKAYMTAFDPKTFELSKVVGKINNIIYENTPSDKFITFFCGILNLESKKLLSVNAGHNPPYLLKKNGDLLTLNHGGVILGVISSLVPYESEITQLDSGDVLFLFTDGITEAMNNLREEFSEERLVELLRKNKAKPASELLGAIVSEVVAFQPVGEQHDDITAVVLKLN